MTLTDAEGQPLTEAYEVTASDGTPSGSIILLTVSLPVLGFSGGTSVLVLVKDALPGFSSMISPEAPLAGAVSQPSALFSVTVYLVDGWETAPANGASGEISKDVFKLRLRGLAVGNGTRKGTARGLDMPAIRLVLSDGVLGSQRQARDGGSRTSPPTCRPSPPTGSASRAGVM